MKRFFILILMLPILVNCNRQSRVYTSDVVIYGGTSAGIICAIQLAMDGKEVCIVEPSGHALQMTVPTMCHLKNRRIIIVNGMKYTQGT